LFLPALSFGQALDALPGIDEPQDADRIHTYTRGFSAAFQLDTLRKYFAADLVEGLAVDPYTSIPDSLRGRFFTSTSDSLYYVDYSGAFYNFTKLQKNAQDYADAAQQAAEDYAETNFGVKKPSKSTNAMALYNGSATVKIVFIGDSNGERQGSYANIVSGSAMAAYGNGGIGYISPGKQASDPNPAWGWGKATRSAGWTVFGKDDIGTNPDMAFLRKIESSNASDTIRYERNDDFIISQSRLNSRVRIFSGKNGATYEYRINNGTWVTVTTPTGGGIHVEPIDSDASLSRLDMVVTVRPKTGTLEHHGVAITSESGGVSSLVPFNMSISGSSTTEHAAIDRQSFIDALTGIGPDEVIVAHSTNDQNSGITPAQYTINLDTIANRVFSATGFQPTFVTGIVNDNEAGAIYPMSDYVVAMESVANARGAKIVNLYDIFSPSGIYDAALYSDGIHYSTEQSSKISRLVMNALKIPVISLSRTTPLKFDVTGYKLATPIDARTRLGVGVARTAATFDVNGEPLQVISPESGTGIRVVGDESDYSIYAKNSTTSSTSSVGYFFNDSNGYGVHSRARNGYAFWAQPTGASAWGFGMKSSTGWGLEVKSANNVHWFEDLTNTNTTARTSFKYVNNFSNIEAGGGGATIYYSTLNGSTTTGRLRTWWQFEDTSGNASYNLSVFGPGLAANLLTPNYSFGGGTAGIFSAPGLSISNSATFGNVEVEDVGDATALTSAVNLGQMIDSLATSGGGGVTQTLSISGSTISLSDGGGSVSVPGDGTGTDEEFQITGVTSSNYDYNSAALRDPGVKKLLRSSTNNGTVIPSFYYNMFLGSDGNTGVQALIPFDGYGGNLGFPVFRAYEESGDTYSAWRNFGAWQVDGLNEISYGNVITSADQFNTPRLKIGTGVDATILGTNNIFEAYDGSTLRSSMGKLGAQVWNLNSGSAEAGKLAYSTPEGNPGLVFFSAAGDARTQVYLHTQTGGLAFGTGSASSNPGADMIMTEGGALGLLGTNPSYDLDIGGTGAIRSSRGTTAQRPTGAAGLFRFNTTNNNFEGYDGSSWGSFQSGDGDGNGIEDGGDVSVPLNTDVQGYSYSGSAAFDTRQQWGHNVSGDYTNGWYTAGANGLGLKHEAVFNSSGVLQSEPYYQSYGANFEYTRLLPKGISHNSNGRYFMLDFYGSKPRTFYDTGTDDWYQSGQDARPTEDAVQVTDSDGLSTWNPYTRVYSVALSSNVSYTTTTNAEIAGLSITGIVPGTYKVEYSITWQDATSPASSGNPDFTYNFVTVGENTTGSGWKSASFQEVLNPWSDTFDAADNNGVGEVILTSDNSGKIRFTTTGQFKFAMENFEAGTNTLIAGSYIRLIKVD